MPAPREYPGVVLKCGHTQTVRTTPNEEEALNNAGKTSKHVICITCKNTAALNITRIGKKTNFTNTTDE